MKAPPNTKLMQQESTAMKNNAKGWNQGLETSQILATRAWVETAIVHLETVARVEARDHTDQPVTQVGMVAGWAWV